MVLLESRAEAAEGERDEALEQLRAATPRPQQSWGSLLELVGEAGAAGRGSDGRRCVGKGLQVNNVMLRLSGYKQPFVPSLCYLHPQFCWQPNTTCCRPAAIPSRAGGAQALAHRRACCAARRRSLARAARSSRHLLGCSSAPATGRRGQPGSPFCRGQHRQPGRGWWQGQQHGRRQQRRGGRQPPEGTH